MFISVENAQMIVEEIKAVTAKDINVIERYGRIIASTDAERIGGIHEGARRLIREGLDMLAIYDTDRIDGAREGINLPISIDGEVVGVIGVTGRAEEVAPLGIVIKKMTEIMVQNIRRQEWEAAADKARNLFAERWLYSDGGNETELDTGSALLGIDLRIPRVIAVVEYSGTRNLDQQMLARAAQLINSEISADPQNVYLQLHGRTVLILNGDSPEAVYTGMEALLGRIRADCGIRAHCGVSSVSENSAQMRRCYNEAKSACRVAGQLNGSCTAMYNECSPALVLQSVPLTVQKSVVNQIFSACSAETKETMLETLRLYYENEGSIENAAAAAYVHKNTFYYRLDQIRKLTGYDIRKPSDSFMLYIAAYCKRE